MFVDSVGQLQAHWSFRQTDWLAVAPEAATGPTVVAAAVAPVPAELVEFVEFVEFVSVEFGAGESE